MRGEYSLSSSCDWAGWRRREVDCKWQGNVLEGASSGREEGRGERRRTDGEELGLDGGGGVGVDDGRGEVPEAIAGNEDGWVDRRGQTVYPRRSMEGDMSYKSTLERPELSSAAR